MRKEKIIKMGNGNVLTTWVSKSGRHLNVSEPLAHPELDGPLGTDMTSVFDVILVESENSSDTLTVLGFAGMNIMLAVLEGKEPTPDYRVDLPTWENRRAFLPLSCWRALDVNSEAGKVILTLKTKRPLDGSLDKGTEYRNLFDPIIVNLTKGKIINLTYRAKNLIV